MTIPIFVVPVVFFVVDRFSGFPPRPILAEGAGQGRHSRGLPVSPDGFRLTV
jgi:hypothetical protein